MERASSQSVAPAAGIRVVATGKTDPGRVRELNEDYVMLAPELDLFLVADGMGGHASGNVASALVARSVRNFFEATKAQPFDEPKHKDDGDAPLASRRLASAIRKANRDVHEISSSHEKHKGMGSTIVALHVEGDVMHIAHVGDSRCYRIRDGELEQLTRDHSLHNEALAMMPNLSPERLAKLPKNVVTRALGMKDTVQVELRREQLLVGDLYLLCSDGLSGMVKDDDILGVAGFAEDLKESCDLLVAMANDAGGKDNISVVLVQVLEGQAPAKVAPPPEPARPSPPEPARPAAPEISTWTELPPPPDEVLVPARVYVLRDAEKEELAALEEAIIEEEALKEARRRRARANQARCPHCEEPQIDGAYYCIECGAEFP